MYNNSNENWSAFNSVAFAHLQHNGVNLSGDWKNSPFLNIPHWVPSLNFPANLKQCSTRVRRSNHLMLQRYPLSPKSNWLNLASARGSQPGVGISNGRRNGFWRKRKNKRVVVILLRIWWIGWTKLDKRRGSEKLLRSLRMYVRA